LSFLSRPGSGSQAPAAAIKIGAVEFSPVAELPDLQFDHATFIARLGEDSYFPDGVTDHWIRGKSLAGAIPQGNGNIP
jgi:hypothetical protein